MRILAFDIVVTEFLTICDMILLEKDVWHSLQEIIDENRVVEIYDVKVSEILIGIATWESEVT
ncbi:8435_t:CDS:2 [Funneliformis geosporum]|uniref:8435_t:CDS:1 n=1 Tax=Funneliformis geosporum TaxID=1117311 RepID=A0A9W4SNR9_9GLOM|nr:8435_t:CDS:2 [Funneliformis geosporum]